MPVSSTPMRASVSAFSKVFLRMEEIIFSRWSMDILLRTACAFFAAAMASFISVKMPMPVSVPASVASGSEVSLTSRWRNVGWGYFPNNLKQWNYKYKVAFALLDSNGEAAQVIVDQECEPSEWISGSTYSYEHDASVEVPAGNYTWAVGIVDTEKDNEPAIDLAVKADKKTGRWVRIADVTVN